jgi:hypothetical protein
VSNSPNVIVEDGIGPDIEDGHGDCRRLSESGEGVGNRHAVCRLPFLIGRISVEEKSHFDDLPNFGCISQKVHWGSYGCEMMVAQLWGVPHQV